MAFEGSTSCGRVWRRHAAIQPPVLAAARCNSVQCSTSCCPGVLPCAAVFVSRLRVINVRSQPIIASAFVAGRGKPCLKTHPRCPLLASAAGLAELLAGPWRRQAAFLRQALAVGGAMLALSCAIDRVFYGRHVRDSTASLRAAQVAAGSGIDQSYSSRACSRHGRR